MHATATDQVTTRRRLDLNHPAMRLFQKAKKLGTWDPRSFDMTQDQKDWQQMTADEQQLLIHLASLFQAGEEAVTVDLLPLIQVIADQGRLEEEMYLTSFLWEESKHVEAFDRFLSEVAGVEGDLTEYHTPSYRTIFYEELPNSLQRLRKEATPEALADASVTYNMVVEGILAETGYYSYHEILRTAGLMPGMQEMIASTKLDESRHIAYGVFLLSRLVAEHGESMWQLIENRINTLVQPAVQIVGEALSRYSPVPFGLTEDMFVGYAMSQFQARLNRIEKARKQSLEEILGTVELEEL